MSRIRTELVAMIDRSLGDDPKAALIASSALVTEVEWLQKRAVAAARVAGYDWGRIGRLLGMTRQAARQKFPLAPPLPPPHRANEDRYLKEYRERERMAERFRSGSMAPPDDDDPVAW